MFQADHSVNSFFLFCSSK